MSSIDDTLCRDLAEYAVGVREARGGYGRCDEAVATVLARFNLGKTAPASPDECGRAVSYARRELGVTVEPDGTEVFPDGVRLESDAAIIAGITRRVLR